MDKKKQPVKKGFGGSDAGTGGSKLLEDALRESEERYRQIFEQDLAVKLLIEPNTGKILKANRAAARFYGYPIETLQQMRISDINQLDPAEIATEMQAALLEKRSYFVFPHRLASGEVRQVEVYSSPIDLSGQRVLYSIIHDITERQQSAVDLRESEEKYRVLFNNEIYAICIFDLETLKLLDVNDAYSRVYGYSRDELISGMTIHDITAEKQVSDAATQQAINEGTIFIPLRYHRKKDGTIFPVEIVGGPYTWKGRKVMFALSHDITERIRSETKQQQAEESLRESEARFRHTSALTSDVAYSCRGEKDGSFSINWMTGAAERITGYSIDEIKSQGCWRFLVMEEDRHLFDKNVIGLVPASKGSCELRLNHKNGSTIWVISFAECIDDSQTPKGLLLFGGLRDITERKQAEEALKESDIRFRELFNHMSSGVAVYEAINNGGDFILRDFNPTAEKIERVSRKDVLGKRVTEVFPGVKTFGIFEVLQRVWQTGKPEYFPLNIYIDKRDPGSWRESWVFKLPSGEIVAVYNDITDRKRVEQALKQSEEKHRTLFDSAGDAIFIHDMEMRMLAINPLACERLGYTHTELMSMTINQVDSQEESQQVPDRIAQLEKHGRLTFATVHRRKDGSLVPTEVSARLITWDGHPALMSICRDITERKRAEKAVKESEEKYRLVVENAQEAIVIIGDGIFKFANSGAVKFTGYSQEELISMPFIEIIHPDDLQMVAERYLQRLKGMDMSNKNTFRVITKAGNIKWVEVSATVINWMDKPASLYFLTDITDRKRLDEERQRVAKLESVGLLAGGIAHDFNNILTSILGNISLARMDAIPGSDMQNSLEQAEKASQRATALTKQLLTFSKGGAPVKKLASLTELLKDTAGFALSGSNVKCHFSIPADLWHAEIDVGQVSQVIHNLVINAQQSMPAGGSIEICTENIDLSKTQSLGKGLPIEEGHYVRIDVTDHGTGIPKDHLEKIFDPFFTTKHKGNGLGLATSFSIAHQHGGHIGVESELGTGSTFYLYLPASMEASAPEQDKKEAMKPVGNARILVMDDEKAVREIAGRMLKHIGYKDVEFAADGAEAIKLYKAAMKSGDTFSVVILDLTIAGGMGGEATVRKLLKIDPSVKAIVSSGYIDDSVIAKFKVYGFSGMVAKPYTIAELRKAVQDVIG